MKKRNFQPRKERIPIHRGGIFAFTSVNIKYILFLLLLIWTGECLRAEPNESKIMYEKIISFYPGLKQISFPSKDISLLIKDILNTNDATELSRTVISIGMNEECTAGTIIALNLTIDRVGDIRVPLAYDWPDKKDEYIQELIDRFKKDKKGINAIILPDIDGVYPGNRKLKIKTLINECIERKTQNLIWPIRPYQLYLPSMEIVCGQLKRKDYMEWYRTNSLCQKQNSDNAYIYYMRLDLYNFNKLPPWLTNINTPNSWNACEFGSVEGLDNLVDQKDIFANYIKGCNCNCYFYDLNDKLQDVSAQHLKSCLFISKLLIYDVYKNNLSQIQSDPNILLKNMKCIYRNSAHLLCGLSLQEIDAALDEREFLYSVILRHLEIDQANHFLISELCQYLDQNDICDLRFSLLKIPFYEMAKAYELLQEQCINKTHDVLLDEILLSETSLKASPLLIEQVAQEKPTKISEDISIYYIAMIRMLSSETKGETIDGIVELNDRISRKYKYFELFPLFDVRVIYTKCIMVERKRRFVHLLLHILRHKKEMGSLLSLNELPSDVAILATDPIDIVNISYSVNGNTFRLDSESIGKYENRPETGD